MDESLDIATLHAAYAANTLTPEALITALYARMERDPQPNAWIHRVSKDEALASARKLAANERARALPLYGIPFAVKDNIDVAGMPTSAACPAYAYTAQVSAPAVAALIEAGALCLGKVNLDQFATGLVGSRSPHGACVNVFDPAFLSGGSSSGSAVLVAAHQVSFALGTDTAGSGRVPAALNNLVGLKPTVGLVSTDGVVPACASLDCVSVFALCTNDAQRILETMTGGPTKSRPILGSPFRFGIFKPLELFGDSESARLFAATVEQLIALGGAPVEIDFAPFAALGDMLYGPTVAERYLAVGSFIESQGEYVLPVTRDIILGGKRFSAEQTLAAMKRTAQLRAACLGALAEVDVLVTPTIPKPYRLAEDQGEPRKINDQLGIYTRFVNYLGSAVLAVPAGFRSDGLPFGISLVAGAGADGSLFSLGAELHARSQAGMGKQRHTPPTSASIAPVSKAKVAVVGAHMDGLALNGQLRELGGKLLKSTRTAPLYRLYVLPNTQPERPGMVRVDHDGCALQLEVWELTFSALGELHRRIPAPLAIGSVTLEDGELVKGFLCEGYATKDARDISALGGFRAYLAQQTRASDQ